MFYRQQIIRQQRPPFTVLEATECRHKRSTLIDICAGSYPDEDYGNCSKCRELIEGDVCRTLKEV